MIGYSIFTPFHHKVLRILLIIKKHMYIELIQQKRKNESISIERLVEPIFNLNINMNSVDDSGIYMIDVNVEPLDQSVENEQLCDSSPVIWRGCVFNQFPICDMISRSDNKVIFSVGHPHQGYTIHAQMKDDKLHGYAKIQTSNNVVIAKVYYTQGDMTGPCLLCYPSGKVFYKGYLQSGYRQGRGTEYSEQGKIIFDGFYDKGNKLRVCPFLEMGDDYWKEMDDNNQLKCVCQMDDQGMYNGICYFFNCGKISRVSECADGNEINVLKEFYSDTMIEYEEGVKVYEGGFLDSLEQYYPRNGAGTEYDIDGETIIFKGMFKDDLRHGMGTSYKNGEPSSSKTEQWIMGRSLNITLLVQILKIVVFLALIIVCLMINLSFGILISVLAIWFLLVRWKSPDSITGVIYDITDFELVTNEVAEYYSNDINQNPKSCKSKMKKWGLFLLKNIYKSTVVSIIIIIICAIIYYILDYFYGGPHNIGFLQKSYIVKNYGGEDHLLRFSLSNYPRLRSIEIGDYCFPKVKVFKINKLNRLITLKVGMYSFSRETNCMCDLSYSFYVKNCEYLKSIQIGRHSFCYSGGDFELKNLPNLQSIQIGTIGSESRNFWYSSFVVQGIDIRLKS